MFWVYVLVGAAVLLSLLWWVDHRRPKRDGAAFDREVKRVEGKAEGRDYWGGSA
ncbi:hypothetical protein [Nocardioides sp. SR21]|uniref:hypothetical protein n=1 Tax=Nocardioides sp. SR21 TaxID=2919501 RepID=UPI001FAB2F97|nr:hypothetical protein [Nocardioides sp. SR21]